VRDQQQDKDRQDNRPQLGSKELAAGHENRQVRFSMTVPTDIDNLIITVTAAPHCGSRDADLQANYVHSRQTD
jgi:hypothetical protein